MTRKPIHECYHETKRDMDRQRPHSRRRIVLQNQLRDLMTRQMRKENREDRRAGR